ncbi:hypothetical protein H7C18_28035 [Cohnella sp. CBP 2801]|uniref:Uncharacterized protein n=1 Tax=Cohnella zeiphila TaxID=2761120 RepID=A0A7X0VYR6_9BACL|nr:RCC1 domain-containing protein [Cohnella zeiphila]MBB6734782.1 hypothetical protein [Cohnella zeiphila]
MIFENFRSKRKGVEGKALCPILWPKNTLAAGRRHTVGLQSDGKVVAAGDNHSGQCDVSDWRGIRLPGKKSDPF